ncbi:MAG: ATPase domain-containing protein [Pseudomonadota bacterium]
MKTFVAPLLKSNGDSIIDKDGRPIYWLDILLGGELQKPERLGRPLVLLLSGPPGSGKSLLVQQMCYNLVREAPANILDRTSLIITTETSPEAIIDNMKRLGLEQIVLLPNGQNRCIYYGLSSQGQLLGELPNMDQIPLMLVMKAPYRSERKKNPNQLARDINTAWRAAIKRLVGLPQYPHVVVIDSLNVLPGSSKKGELFGSLVQMFQTGPDFLFLIIDTPWRDTGEVALDNGYWEYVADISIRMDYEYLADKGYFARHFQIVKSRYQEHVPGKHATKIFSNPQVNRAAQPVNLAIDRDGTRPHLFTGGVFLFPSFHCVLSQSRFGEKLVRTDPQRPAPSNSAGTWANPANYNINPPQEAAWGPGSIVPPTSPPIPAAGSPVKWDNWDPNTDPPPTLNWPVKYCFELVDGGIPLNHCTALVGRRGARKSYFAYQFLLDGIKNGEKVMLLSFRDNQEAVKMTLRAIMGAPQYTAPPPLTDNDLNQKLVIVYQCPGCVTPEEWLHRVITIVGEHSPTRVVFNAVDQWESAYPLLAASPMLLPTLIDFLNVHEVTSMVIGVEGGARSFTEYGLTTRAETVLSFEYRRIPWQQPTRTRPSDGPSQDGYAVGVPLVLPGTLEQPKVVVRAVRVPRGAAAGFGRAVLEHLGTTIGAGLEMVPIAPQFPEGELI